METVPTISSKGYRDSSLARAQADLKFTYVVTCQIYGQQKQKQDHRAADILYLMQKYNLAVQWLLLVWYGNPWSYPKWN